MATQNISYQSYHIRTFSEGNGHPILFLHGWPTNSRLWASQVATFQSSFRTITLDWLGFGQSDKAEELDYSFSESKKMLNAVIEQLLKKNEQITIVAHDIGGPPAILWASEHPERIRQFILLNTVLYPFSTPLDKMSHAMFRVPLIKNLIVSPFGLKMLMRTLVRNRTQEAKSRIEEVLNWPVDLPDKVKLRTILSPLHTGKKQELPTLADRLASVKDKTHLIIGKKDPLCYQHMHAIREQYPDIPASILPQCGHFVPIDMPSALNDRLWTILKQD